MKCLKEEWSMMSLCTLAVNLVCYHSAFEAQVRLSGYILYRAQTVTYMFDLLTTRQGR